MSRRIYTFENENKPATPPAAAPDAGAKPAAQGGGSQPVENNGGTPPAAETVLTVLDDAGRPIENAAGAAPAGGTRLTAQLGNASVALATEPIQRLSTYVCGLPPQPLEQVTDFLFPRIEAGFVFDYVVAAAANQFAIIDDDLVGHNGLPRVVFMDPNTTVTRRLQFRGVETPYPYEDQLVDAGAGGRGLMSGEQYRVRFVNNAIELGRFSRAVAAVAASGVGEGTLDFSADNDPISELQTKIETLLAACPVPRSWVRILFGGSAWTTLLQHKYLTGGGTFARQLITKAQIAQHLDLADSQIQISRVQAVTSKQGKTTTKDVILGGTKVLIFIAADTANEEDPSFGKTFCKRLDGGYKKIYRNVTHSGLNIYNIGEAYYELMVITMAAGLTRHAVSTT